jgi:hypothetical protein
MSLKAAHRNIERLDWEDEEDLKTRKTAQWRRQIKKGRSCCGVDPFLF